MYKNAILFINLIMFFSIATAQDNIGQIVKESIEAKLFEDPYWRALLHYRQIDGKPVSGWESDIVSTEFFLAENGATDPEAELVATIRAIYRPVTENPDLHAQCRFVARYQWLAKQMAKAEFDPPPVNCGQFEEYSFAGKIKSISAVFATGFLGNPASYYGHVLLKFNTDREFGVARLLDHAINFGAKVPDHENPLVYVVKGVLGGYEAGFSHEKFYRNNHIYVENELRDLWDYELELSQEQVDQIVAHSWELLGQRYQYYFAKENCAYRMGELLELVVDEPMYSRELPWALPADMFERLSKVQRKDKSIIRKIEWIPSRQSLFYAKYNSLTENLKKIAGEMAHHHDFKWPEYVNLSAQEKNEIADVLFDYYEYRIVVEDDDQQLKSLKNELLQERLKNSQTGGVEKFDTGDVQPPHKGPLASMLQYSLYSNNRFGSGAGIRFRPAYFDTLSLDESRIPNSTLTMMDFHAIYMNDKLFIKHFDFMNVQSLSLSKTRMRDDKDWAWKMKFGIETLHPGCIDCQIFNAVGGGGKAVHLFSQNSTVYGMMEANLQSKYQDFGTAGVAAYIGVIGYPVDGWKTHLVVGNKQYLDGSVSEVNVIKWNNRFGKSRRWDVRVSYEHNLDDEISLGYGFYW